MDRPQNKLFLSHLHAFRGVAILAIVGAHCWSGYIWVAGTVKNRPDLNFIYTFTETLFHGSTLFFALISGLLFTLILRNRGFTSFFKSKLSNVILPYGVITLFFTFIDLSYHQQVAEADGTSTAFLAILFNNLIWGKGVFHLWYIPVLVILFLCTPLVNIFLKKPSWNFVVALLALAPLVISRTEYPNLISWQSIVFFMGAYSLGMLAGEHYECVKTLISKYLMFLWIIVVISSLGVFYLTYLQYEPHGSYSLKQTFVYLQKMSAVALFIDYLSAREEKPSKVLKILGSHAFSIYFLHAYLGFLIIDTVTANKLFEINTTNIAWLGALTYATVILLSLAISILLKKLLGRYSRNIIGS